MSAAPHPILQHVDALARELSLHGVRPGAGRAGGQGDSILVMLALPSARAHPLPALPGDFGAALRTVEAEIYDAP
jgi:hypothetical protein